MAMQGYFIVRCPEVYMGDREAVSWRTAVVSVAKLQTAAQPESAEGLCPAPLASFSLALERWPLAPMDVRC